jgi:hypothetical protein
MSLNNSKAHTKEPKTTKIKMGMDQHEEEEEFKENERNPTLVMFIDCVRII